MLVGNSPRPITTQERAQLASDLGKFILDHLPYGARINFPPLPPVPTQGTMAALEATLQATDAAMPEGVRIPKRYKTDKIVDMDGLYPAETAAAPLAPMNFVSNGELMDFDEDGQLLYWEMNDSYHQITKAVRIWYTYTVPSYEKTDKEGKPVLTAESKPKVVEERTFGTWLLFGYVGDGH